MTGWAGSARNRELYLVGKGALQDRHDAVNNGCGRGRKLLVVATCQHLLQLGC